MASWVTVSILVSSRGGLTDQRGWKRWVTVQGEGMVA